MYLISFSPPSPDTQMFCVKMKHLSHLGETGRNIQWQEILNSIFMNDRPISGKYKLFWCLSRELVELIDLLHLHYLLRHSLPQGMLKDKFLESENQPSKLNNLHCIFTLFFPPRVKELLCVELTYQN